MHILGRKIVFFQQEFLLATNVTSAGSIEEKLKLAFKMYDKDDSGIRSSFMLRLSNYFERCD